MASSKVRIGSIELSGFRGVRKRKVIRLQGKSLLLHGENGTGKSSFVEGVERALTGHLSSLEGRGQGINPDRHAIHILDSKPSVSVTLTTGDAITLAGSNTRLSPAAQAYAAAARSSDHFILRRGRVLSFIEAAPKERYELLRPFLALGPVTSLEAALGAAVQRLEAKETTAAADERSARDDLLRLTGIEFAGAGTSPATILAAVQRTLTDIALPPPVDLAGIPAALREVETAIEAAQSKLAALSPSPTAQPDLSALRDLGELPVGFTTAPLLHALEDERSRDAAVRDEAAGAMRSALADISAWIDESGPSACPVCEQPIDPQRVSARIKVRLAPLNDLLAAQAVRQARQHELDAAIQSVINAVVRASARPAGVADDWWNPREATLSESRKKLDVAKSAVQTGGTGNSLAAGALDDVRAALSRLAADAQLPCAPSGSGEAAQLKERITKLYRLRDILPQIEPLLAVQAARTSATTEAARRTGIARRILSHLQNARKKTVQAIYTELAGDIDRFYSRVHPREAVGGISLEIRSAGQGSANLRGRFHDRDGEDPRAYFSEAHLDTLGVCVFLALRKRLLRAEPDFDLLVLDDVLTSVDAPHASRLADLLLTEFAGCQFLITTHNRVWYEHLRGLVASKGLDQDLISLVIHDWTLEEGPDIRDFTEERGDLAEAIKSGSLSAIAGGAGRLLENSLCEMRFAMGLAVEAKRDERYTLMDLWPAFAKRVRKEFKGLATRCETPMADIERLWFTRNWAGAHYNEWAKELSIKDARELASAVLELFSCLRCPECLRFVTRSVTPTGQLACKKGCTVIFEQKSP